MSEEIFEGAEINGKKFPFKRLTISSSAKMVKILMPSFYQSLKNIFFSYNQKKYWWKKVRSAAFERRGLWRFGIIPRELRCSVVEPKKAEEIEESFFVYAPEIVRECERLSKYRNPLLMASKDKSEAH